MLRHGGWIAPAIGLASVFAGPVPGIAFAAILVLPNLDLAGRALGATSPDILRLYPAIMLIPGAVAGLVVRKVACV